MYNSIRRPFLQLYSWRFITNNKSRRYIMCIQVSFGYGCPIDKVEWISQLLIWWNYDICVMLDQHAERDFILILLWNNSLQVDMLFHCDTLPWLRANQSTYEWCVISSNLQMYSLWFDRTEHWVQDLPHSRRVDKIVQVEIFCSTTTVFSEVFRCHPPLKHTSKI